jgi:broad specificity phosphatase PhoE
MGHLVIQATQGLVLKHFKVKAMMISAKIREKEPATMLLFCRHGATDYPEDRFYPSGPSSRNEDEDPGLNEQGHHQAQKLEKYFIDLNQRIDAFYVSPTLRTRQTLQPVLQGRNLSMLVIPELREREMGEWSGCTAQEVQQKDPEGWRRWKTEPLSFNPPGGESLQDFSHRVNQAVDLIVEKESGRNVVIVTHVGPIRAVTAASLGMPLENCKRLVVANGSVTRIDYTKSWPNLVLFGYQP